MNDLNNDKFRNLLINFIKNLIEENKKFRDVKFKVLEILKDSDVNMSSTQLIEIINRVKFLLGGNFE